MKRMIVGLVLVLLAASCASSGPGELGPVGDGGSDVTPTPTQSVEPTSPAESPSTEPNGSGETMTYEVWFSAGQGSLFVTHRTEPATPRVGAAAVQAWLAGPTAAERAAGLVSAAPEGVELLGLTVEGGLATVDLSGDFASGGGSLLMMLRLAELTYTLSQFPTVNGVILQLDGERVETFSSEGIVTDRPLTRRMWKDLLPAILVEEPGIGERVSSPFTVVGSADVFEATVSISLLNAAGEEIVRTFTTATCGTGCRGTYEKTIRYRVPSTQRGTLRVYEVSAKDGSPINVVEIPVVLSA